MTEHIAIVYPNLTIVAIVTKLQDLVIFSLVPGPEEEEEKGPGFSHLCMCLISSELSTFPSVGGC